MPDERQQRWRVGRREFGRLVVTTAGAVAAGCAFAPEHDGASPPAVSSADPVPLEHVAPQRAFPRSATCFLAQQDLPSPDLFARYGLVVIDSEWFGRLGPGFFNELRNRNPAVRVLAYVNLVDYPQQLGDRDEWGDRYALWQYRTPTQSSFPRDWLATTAGDVTLSQWPDTLMTNLTDGAPRVDGRTFAQYAAAWVVDRVWSAGVWDGIYLDVWGDQIWSADYDAWDYRRDGVDTPEDEIYGADAPWGRGVNEAERIMRARMPEAILISNGTRTMRNQQLNGRVWEDFLDVSTGPGRDRDLVTYLNESTNPNTRHPVYPMTIDIRGAAGDSAQDYQRARYFLTATMMGDGYWAPMLDDSYAQPSYYDELDGGGLGPGYLGMPVVDEHRFDRLSAPFAGGLGVVAPDVYRRDFDRGVVLHNAGDSRRTVALEHPFRHLDGTQAPDVNNGRLATSVDLGPRDGLVLLRI